ncbi:hypothetical protein 1 [Wenzhou shrimp virus 9]|uniref:hypothetical protein 1 n=1 Tax=Wenzhou shrimp virus 9 TaxID=1923656 RepID=UPI00090B0EF0|nr:hypothetical protein 1 [Wenzhou shrimp virus 9]APG75818.1 hypothetical protein 1 [Wenzhou shrimp virus 9]QTG68214.1 protease-like protein [Laem Singh virus]
MGVFKKILLKTIKEVLEEEELSTRKNPLTIGNVGKSWLAAVGTYKKHLVVGALVGAGALAYRYWKNRKRPSRVVRDSFFRAAITGDVVPESKVAGSPEVNLLAPNSQCRILLKNSDGDWVLTGCAVRVDLPIGPFLVFPQHLCAGELAAMSSRDEVIPLSLDGLEPIAADLSMLPCPSKLTSTGLASPTIGVVRPGQRCVVSVVGVDGLGTTGPLQTSPVFGRLIYGATTNTGYSGAAYASARTVYGVHTNGGKLNGGFALSYVYAMMKVLKGVRDESSENWIHSVMADKSTRFLEMDYERVADSIVMRGDDGFYHAISGPAAEGLVKKLDKYKYDAGMVDFRSKTGHTWSDIDPNHWESANPETAQVLASADTVPQGFHLDPSSRESPYIEELASQIRMFEDRLKSSLVDTALKKQIMDTFQQTLEPSRSLTLSLCRPELQHRLAKVMFGLH